jgi:hypothetical protein
LDRASPHIRALAKQLKAFETPRNTSSEVDNAAAFRAVDTLRPHLPMLMGRTGFQALLARALVLAAAELPWLATVRGVSDGELEGLIAAQESLDAADFSEGEVVLLTHLIGLLVTFIGPALTLRLLNQVWPQLSFNDSDFSNAATNQEAK